LEARRRCGHRRLRRWCLQDHPYELPCVRVSFDKGREHIALHLSGRHSANPAFRRPSSSLVRSSGRLELIDKLTSEPALRTYHLLPSMRGDLLEKLGRLDEARAEFERAAQLTRNERERKRKLLLARAADCVRN
jgi:hypothetical protein